MRVTKRPKVGDTRTRIHHQMAGIETILHVGDDSYELEPGDALEIDEVFVYSGRPKLGEKDNPYDGVWEMVAVRPVPPPVEEPEEDDEAD